MRRRRETSSNNSSSSRGKRGGEGSETICDVVFGWKHCSSALFFLQMSPIPLGLPKEASPLLSCNHAWLEKSWSGWAGRRGSKLWNQSDNFPLLSCSRWGEENATMPKKKINGCEESRLKIFMQIKETADRHPANQRELRLPWHCPEGEPWTR